MIDEIQCQKVLEEWRADSPKVDVWVSLPAPPIMKKKKRKGKEKKKEKRKREFKIALPARCGIIPNVFENINSMISGKQKAR